ncbi:hypothetical protein [Saccharothrix sp. Mg75]|uniref:hypothetical protein n=1 Tax=Saccharothrix sp. Mg75 TaxID=3445357 RepID=UPI003EEF8EF2
MRRLPAARPLTTWGEAHDNSSGRLCPTTIHTYRAGAAADGEPVGIRRGPRHCDRGADPPRTSLAAQPAPIHVPKWAYAVALLVTWVVLQENGVALGHAAETVHEFFHDGRHALGVPCH